jgi:hypothetical protein
MRLIVVTTFRTANGETILAESGPLPPGAEPTPLDRLQQHHGEAAQALVILPFISVEQAEQFALLVTAQFAQGGFNAPIVTTGTAYEFINPESNEAGQVFELYPGAGWEAFIKDGNEQHHVLQRVTKEAPDEERTG